MSKLIPGYYRCDIPTTRWKSAHIKTGDEIRATKFDLKSPKRVEKLKSRFTFLRPFPVVEKPKKKAPQRKKQRKQGGK